MKIVVPDKHGGGNNEKSIIFYLICNISQSYITPQFWKLIENPIKGYIKIYLFFSFPPIIAAPKLNN